MADLSIEIAGMKFKNPVWGASAEPYWGFKRIKRAIDAGAGAVVAKSLPPPGFPSRDPRYCVLDENRQPVRGGKIPKLFTLYCTSAGPVNEDEYLEELEESEKYAAQHDACVIGSLFSMPHEDLVRISRKMEQIGLKALEVSVLPLPGQISTLATLVGPIKETVSIPVFAKLSSPETLDLISATREMVEQFNVAGITCHDRYSGFCVDIEAGKPFLGVWARVGGPWVLPMTLSWVSKIHVAMPEVPILGTGGPYDWRDVVSFHMAGASAVQICSAVMFKGYKIITDAVTGLNEFLDRKGYNSVGEIVGIAAKAARPSAEADKVPGFMRRASVDMEECIDCEKCLEMCWFDALERIDGEYKVNTENCKGCGNCEIVCPAGAINWIS